MKKLVYIIPLVVFGLLAIIPGIGAQTIENPPVVAVTTTGLIGILNYVMRIFYTVFFILAIIFILLAGFGYLTAGGDPAKVKKASNRLIFGIVAVAIGLVATGIKAFVQGFITTGQSG